MKTILLALLLAIPIAAQTVEVPQAFLDTANKSFIEVKALRELETARKSEIEAKDALAASQTSLIEALKQGITVRDEQIKALSRLSCDRTSLFFGLIVKKSCK